MNLPHPKHLIPALFALVAGVPMLMQASIGPMAVSASVTGTEVAQQEGIDPDALLDAEVEEADYGYEADHYLRRSLRLGSCSDSWKKINMGVHKLCKRILEEMGSDRSDMITRKMLRQNKNKMHSAASTGKTTNEFVDTMESARPTYREAMKYKYNWRRGGDLPESYSTDEE